MSLLFDAIKTSDYLALKKILRTDKSALNEEDEQGASPLAYALRQRSDQDILELLLEYSADINEIDNEGVNILEYAITYGNTFFVKRLLELGVDPTKTQRRSGFTPLMAAVSYNHVEIVQLFLEKGCSLLDKDKSGFTAIDFAKRMHRKKIAALIETYQSDHSE